MGAIHRLGDAYNPADCSLAPAVCQAMHDRAASWQPDPVTAYNYAIAPGCNVVDLSKNWCLYDDGTTGGCNSMPECDPLDLATHYQLGVPGPPVNTAIPALKTGLPAVITTYTSSPDLNLQNPTGGIPYQPQTQKAIQDAIVAALGPQAKSYAAALADPRVTIQQLATTPSGGPLPGALVTPGAPGSGPAGSGVNMPNVVPSVVGPTTNWFTETSVGTIPNWLLLAGGLGAAFFLFKVAK